MTKTEPDLRPTRGSLALVTAMSQQKIRAADAARRIGVSDATLGRWLKGARIPTAEYLLAIETAFGVKAALWGQRIDAPANDAERKAG